MLGPDLEFSDLRPSEVTFFLFLRRHGAIAVPPGAVIRPNLIEQVLRRAGPLGSGFPEWRRLHIEGVGIAEKLDLADTHVDTAVHFYDCLFLDENECFDVSRSGLADLRMTGCVFAGTVRLDSVRVRSNLLITRCEGGNVILTQATVGANLVVRDVRLAGSGTRLTLDEARVEGALEVTDSIISEISALFARVAGPGRFEAVQTSQLSLDSSTFETNLTVAQLLDTPKVSSSGVRVGGDLRVINVRRAETIDLSRCRVSGAVFLAELRVHGEIILAGTAAERMEFVDLDAFNNGDSPFSCEGVTVAADVRIGPGWRVIGEFRLLGATIGGQLLVHDGVPYMSAPMWVNGEGIVVSSGIFLEESNSNSHFHLAGSTFDSLTLRMSDPARVELLGARFRSIGDGFGRSITARNAITILDRSKLPFNVEPFRAVADWMRSSGAEQQAREVYIAGERRVFARRGLAGRAWGRLLDATFGFGYRPGRALVILLGVIVVSAVLFGFLYSGQVLWLPVARPPATPPFEAGGSQSLFNPLTFAVAAILPAGGDMLTAWRPSTAGVELVVLGVRSLGAILAVSVAGGLVRRLSK